MNNRLLTRRLDNRWKDNSNYALQYVLSNEKSNIRFESNMPIDEKIYTQIVAIYTEAIKIQVQ